MLQQLFHILIVSIVCIIWGIPVIMITDKSATGTQRWWYSGWSGLAFLFFCGCLSLSVISSWLYLFMPLHYSVLAVLTLLLLLILIIFFKQHILSFLKVQQNFSFRINSVFLIFIVPTLVTFLVLSTLQPVHGDTQIYHLQIIRWQTEYRVVPGIANLFPRFGLGSNWFNLISLFYFPWFKNETFSYLNAALAGWFFIWLFSAWHFHYQKFQQSTANRILSLFYFLILLFSLYDWQLFRDTANSTNYDFVVNAFIILVFSFFLERILQNENLNSFSNLVFLFCISLLTFKLSGIFILLLLIYHIYNTRKNVNKYFVIISGLVVISPVLIKNYITSGYPLFPSTFTITKPDWQLPHNLAEGIYRYIIITNRFYNWDYSIANHIHLTIFNWIPYWIKGILWQHRIVVLLAVSSIVFLLFKFRAVNNQKKLQHIVIILLLMISGWFFTAPDPPRFGYGTLLTSAFMTSSILFFRFIHKKMFIVILWGTGLITAYYCYNKSAPIINNKQYLLYPIAFKIPPYKSIAVNEVDFHLPNIIQNNWDHRCYFTPLPCITQENPYLVPRGKFLKDGFRMIQEPDSNFVKNYAF
jgi:hypothetical protein